MGFFDWFKQEANHTKRARRYSHPPIAAFWWNGGVPTTRRVKDISSSGAFLQTPERWYPGTILTVTFQVLSGNGEDSTAPSVSLPCKVVRHGSDGVAVSFMFREGKDRKAFDVFVRDVVVNGHCPGVPHLIRGEGQSAIEFALMIPVLFLLMVYAINYGSFLFAWITISNAVRSAAQYAALGNASAGHPAVATAGTITTLIQNETSSLPGATPTVTVCLNNNGTVTALGGGSCSASVTAPPQDPEAICGTCTSTYSTLAVDVTYTYTPFFNFSQFFSFSMGLPPTTVHRRTVMRVLS